MSRLQTAHCATWDRADLVRRVRQALDTAGRAVAAVAGSESQTKASTADDWEHHVGRARSDIRPLLLPKVAGETAMLLRSVAFPAQIDGEIAQTAERLARRLIPLARHESVPIALCMEPPLALNHASAHIQLRDLGYKHSLIDSLLANILEDQTACATERLPNHDLECAWLARLWFGIAPEASCDRDLLRRTCVGNPLDALGSATLDLYAFTHVVLYATDMGRHFVEWPRSAGEILADAEAALAAAIDADNFDLAAELLWTWPMLGAAWSAPAIFSFALLAQTQDQHGFLPGPGYVTQEHDDLPERLREEYVLRTSYHADIVMGILCAAMLRSESASPIDVPRKPHTNSSFLHLAPLLLEADCREPRWKHNYQRLDAAQRESLAEFLLTMALRRARASRNFEQLREAIRIGLSCGLIEGPAFRQALSLLRRTTMLASTMLESSIDLSEHSQATADACEIQAALPSIDVAY